MSDAPIGGEHEPTQFTELLAGTEGVRKPATRRLLYVYPTYTTYYITYRFNYASRTNSRVWP
jgi:hypothetical protein